jgi:hypothetical protein
MANDIDVCDRRGFPEHEINRRTEGMQAVGSPRAVGAMPFGGSLVVFASELSASDPDRTEIRGTLLGPEGTPLRTCEQDVEYTYAEVDPQGPVEQRRVRPALAAPMTDDAAGLIAYLAQQADGTWEIMGRFVSGTGCPYQGLAPFPISSDGPDHWALPPSVTSLSRNEFLVVWPSEPSDPSSLGWPLRARLVQADALGPQFLPTVLSPGGDAVDLAPPSFQAIFAAATVVGEGRFMVTWMSNLTTGPVVWAAVFDDRFNAIEPPFMVGSGNPGLPVRSGIDMAFDGSQVMVVWVARDAGDLPRVWGRFLTADGDFLRAPQAPDGDMFLVSDVRGGPETRPAVMPLADGGFVVVWEEGGRDGADTENIAGRTFHVDGAPRFNNRACGRGDLALNLADEGPQLNPSLAQLDDGSITAAWTDGGFNGPDRSSTSVRSVVLTPRDLFPLE